MQPMPVANNPQKFISHVISSHPEAICSDPAVSSCVFTA